jgi:6-phosphofructokinase 1
MTNHLQHLGIFTSGGDSPGMNACIRAVVRASVYHGLRITGIRRGYQGLIEGDFVDLDSRSVSNIIQRGGTILKSARSKDFLDSGGRQKAYENCSSKGIEAIVAIGGDGTFKGAEVFMQEFEVPIIGVPGTIDNDLSGTDFTLGFDTAVNTAVQAIDKIRDTAASHDRIFFIEVMGRDAGYIALNAGIAAGAESILIPEDKTDISKLVKKLDDGRKNEKTSSIVVVSEGDEAGGAFEIAAKVRKLRPEYDTKVTILGHIQRGGSPTVADRILGTRLGVASVEALLNGMKGVMAGVINDKVKFTPLQDCIKLSKPFQADYFKVSDITSI